MKRTSSCRTTHSPADELRPEYRLDYRLSRSNRFARSIRTGSVGVVLEPDVASVFRSSKDVNTLLRSVISALLSKPRRPRSGKKTI
jgi:hypothetical protein